MRDSTPTHEGKCLERLELGCKILTRLCLRGDCTVSPRERFKGHILSRADWLLVRYLVPCDGWKQYKLNDRCSNVMLHNAIRVQRCKAKLIDPSRWLHLAHNP